MTRKVLLCTAAGLLALAVACGKTSPAPTSPSSATPGSTSAAPDGSTLKAPAPPIVSPTGGVQADDPTTLTANTVKGKFDQSLQLSYNFQVRSGTTVVAQGTVGPTTGSTVSFVPTGLDFEVNYTWRVQATYQGANGPWSADASFKTAAGAYIRGAELRDPLTNGKTVGTLIGNAALTANGVNLPDASSWVQYQLPVTLQAGEFSAMITGLSTKVHGAKSSVMAMGEGTSNITTNDYRATMDFRARDYPQPGSVTCRFITGDHVSRIFDCDPRLQVSGWDPSRWYLWTLTWRTGSTNLKVVETETGRVMYNVTIGTGSHAYNPQPHVLYLGKPVPRGGEVDGTAWPITIKNAWASANPRPTFGS
jgi:hypothetical protein